MMKNLFNKQPTHTVWNEAKWPISKSAAVQMCKDVYCSIGEGQGMSNLILYGPITKVGDGPVPFNPTSMKLLL